MSDSFVEEWAKAQRLKGPSMKNASVFYRNMEEELDARRAQHACLTLHTRDAAMVDFSSTDVLGLSSSGAVRRAFLDVLSRHGDFKLSSHGSRLTDGNSGFLEEQERELAAFHGSEAALVVGTGHAGNGAIFSVVPRPGDAIVYDELVHASVHDGMKDSLALCRKPFRHNSVDSFLETLAAVRDSQPQIRDGSRCVLVAVESVYSMDGDICPLRELVEVAKEIFPNGNAQFVIDEAHGTGVLGPNGAGLVNSLGLEKEIAIRLHTFGKALAASGGTITSNSHSSFEVIWTDVLPSRDTLQQYCPRNAAELRQRPSVHSCTVICDARCDQGNVWAPQVRSHPRGNCFDNLSPSHVIDQYGGLC